MGFNSGFKGLTCHDDDNDDDKNAVNFLSAL